MEKKIVAWHLIVSKLCQLKHMFFNMWLGEKLVVMQIRQLYRRELGVGWDEYQCKKFLDINSREKTARGFISAFLLRLRKEREVKSRKPSLWRNSNHLQEDAKQQAIHQEATIPTSRSLLMIIIENKYKFISEPA